MEVETKEQVVTEEEQEETPIIEKPSSEAEAEGKTEVSEESEGEGEEKAPKLTEEERQGIIGEEYAKWQSKTLTPITKERDTLRQQVTDLQAQLEDKHDKDDIELLYEADVEEFGEERAKRAKELREKEAPFRREYMANAKLVKEAAEIAKGLADEFLPEVAENLGFNDKTPLGILKAASNAIRLTGIGNRHHEAVEKAYEVLLPQDKNFRKQLDAIVEELEQAESPEHMERLLKLIIRERSGKQKPFTPDSGRNSGSGVDLSKLSTDERLKRALKIMDKQK